MLYCSIHNKLYVSHIQQWIPLPAEQFINLEGIMLEGPCHQCVAEAKHALMQQFPTLYAHAFFHPAVSSLPPPTTTSHKGVGA